MLWHRCPVCHVLQCLSVMLVYCGQTVGWIKMKLGTDLSAPATVLDGGPAPPHPVPKRAQPPIFVPCLLWPNGWMDQDATWYGGRLQSRRYCVRWGASSPQNEGTAVPLPIFGPCLSWQNGWMDQNATWYGNRPWSRRHCVRWGPGSPHPPKKMEKSNPVPNFRSIVSKRLNGSRCHFVRR